MASECCHSLHDGPATWRPVLWFALAINAGMFLTEIVAGLMAGSVSLQADALDFLGDAFNYGVSLAVVGLALTWRARAALLKGITMCLFGLWVVGTTAWHLAYGAMPQPFVMGAIGALALAANAAVAPFLPRLLIFLTTEISRADDFAGTVANRKARPLAGLSLDVPMMRPANAIELPSSREPPPPPLPLSH
jgi:hypothetical protein